MLLQTNSYIVPKDKRVHHARLMRRFRQTMHRLGCDQFEAYEQVAANWNSAGESGRFVQIMRFRDRRHQQAVQIAEREDAGAQQLIAEFCNLINLPYQHQHGYFSTGFYTSVPGVAPAPIEEYFEDEFAEDGAAPEGHAAAFPAQGEAGPAIAAAEAAEELGVPAGRQQHDPAFGQSHHRQDGPTAQPGREAHEAWPPEGAESFADTPITTDSAELAAGAGAVAHEVDEQAAEAIAAGTEPANASDAPADAGGTGATAELDTFAAAIEEDLAEFPAAAPAGSAGAQEAAAEGPQALSPLDEELAEFEILPTGESDPADALAPVSADSPEALADGATLNQVLDDAAIPHESHETIEVAEDAPAVEETETEAAATEHPAHDGDTSADLELEAPEITADFAERTIAVPSAENDVVTVGDVLAARHAHESDDAPVELEPLEIEATTEEAAPGDPQSADTTRNGEHQMQAQSEDQPVIPTIDSEQDSDAEAFEAFLRELNGSAAPEHGNHGR